MAKRKIARADGHIAVAAVVQHFDDAAQHTEHESVSRPTLATAVRYLLEELAERAPGNTVEMRVPPFGATQCIAGPRHTRGTPPNVIETDPLTWVALATGQMSWETAVNDGAVRASGSRADIAALLPLLRLPALP